MVEFHSLNAGCNLPPKSQVKELEEHTDMLEELRSTVEPLETELDRLRRRRRWKKPEKDPRHAEWVVRQLEKELQQLKDRIKWYEERICELKLILEGGSSRGSESSTNRDDVEK